MANEVVKDDVEAEGVEQDRYLVFTIRSQEFGIQAIRVREITSVSAITEVPNAPPYIEGIMNLRGRLASVINSRKKFGFEPKEYDEDTSIIIVEQDRFPIGILVDSVEEVIKIPDEVVQKLPESTSVLVSEGYITGVGVLDNRLIILLDVDKVLTITELIEVGAVRQAIDNAQTMETPEGAESNKIDAKQYLHTEKQTDKREGE